MPRLVLLTLALSLAAFALQTERLHADTCSCPWQVIQLTSTNSSCALATQNAQQNAGSWASFQCGGTKGGLCTYAWTDLGCSVDSNGTATDTSLINYKCNACP